MTMARSSQSENSKISNSVNELNCRFEMMDNNISDEEKIAEVDHYIQQLVNSEYSVSQIRDIVMSSIRRLQKREIKMKERSNRYRSAEESLESRIKKKLLEAMALRKKRIILDVNLSPRLLQFCL